jgi:hypothetical protein
MKNHSIVDMGGLYEQSWTLTREKVSNTMLLKLSQIEMRRKHETMFQLPSTIILVALLIKMYPTSGGEDTICFKMNLTLSY